MTQSTVSPTSTSSSVTSPAYSPTSVYSSPTAASSASTPVYVNPAERFNTSPSAPLTKPQSTASQVSQTLNANSSEPFLKISTPSGVAIYAEYGKVVSSTQFNADLAAANATTAVNYIPATGAMRSVQNTLYNQGATLGQQYSTSPQEYASELNFQQRADLANSVPTNRGAVLSLQNTLYNQGAIIGPQYSTTPNQLIALQKQQTPSSGISISGPGGSVLNDIVNAAGYGGFFLSLAPREAYSLLTTGKSTYIPLPSQSEVSAAGSFGLLAGAAVGVGFVAAPLEAAIIPALGLSGSGATLAGLGIQAGLGAGYGGVSSYATGGNPVTGALEGGLLFPASGIVGRGVSILGGRIGESLVRFVPDPNQVPAEDPYVLNFFQRAIANRYIVPQVESTLYGLGGSQGFGTPNRAAAFAAEVGSRMQGISGTASTPYASSFDVPSGGGEEGETVNVGGGQQQIVRSVETRPTTATFAPQQQKIEGFVFQPTYEQSVTESSTSAAYRIAQSRGQTLYDMNLIFLTTPPGYTFKSSSRLSDLSLQGQIQSGIQGQVSSSLQVQGLTPLTIQALLQSGVQTQAQESTLQQLQSETQVQDLGTIGLLSFRGDLLGRESGSTDLVLPYPPDLPTVGQRKRKRGQRFRPTQERNRVAREIGSSFGDFAAALEGSDIFGSTGYFSAPRRKRAR